MPQSAVHPFQTPGYRRGTATKLVLDSIWGWHFLKPSGIFSVEFLHSKALPLSCASLSNLSTLERISVHAMVHSVCKMAPLSTLQVCYPKIAFLGRGSASTAKPRIPNWFWTRLQEPRMTSISCSVAQRLKTLHKGSLPTAQSIVVACLKIMNSYCSIKF